jgi:uncharacterized protein YjiS (DUF1127 family)
MLRPRPKHRRDYRGYTGAMPTYRQERDPMPTASVTASPIGSHDFRPVAALRWLCAALFWLAALQRRHRERMQLAEMDDAALKDIGLSRCDVMAEVAKPSWRR